MEKKIKERKIVFVNQAVNYLTIGICNAFAEEFEDVALITGSIHMQGEDLNKSIKISEINRWVERPMYKKFLSYILACIRSYWLLITRYRSHEVFFISLPPMAYLMSIILPNRCSILVWDIYPDLFKITGMKESNPVFKSWAYLNTKAFAKAYRIFTIGDRMADLLSKYVERENIIITPLWSIFQSNVRIEKHENPFIKKHELYGKFVVQYSGNIGLTHNVELMVELADLMSEDRDVLFQIIGRGPRKPYLKSLVEKRNLPNCQFLSFQPDEMFPYSLSAADIGVVILDERTSKGSVPSKSYNLMNYGIPSLYIASEDSELNNYALKYGHAKCISHDNLDEAIAFIRNLKANQRVHQEYAGNAIKASGNYLRGNADLIAEKYLSKKVKKNYHVI